MKFFKIAYNIFVNKILFNVIIIIEIAALIILSNIVIATYNSKNMLYTPYKNILNNDGVLFTLNSTIEYINNSEEFINNMYKNLQGDVRIVTSDSFNTYEDGELVSNMAYDNGKVEHILLDSDVLNNLSLPLSAGRWCSSERNQQGQIEIVVSGGTNAELNKVYNGSFGDMVVVGILETNTYRPATLNFNYNEESNNGIFGLFEEFDSNVSTQGAFLLANKELFADIDSNIGYKIGSIGMLVSYGSDVNDDIKEKNKEYLKSIGNIESNFSELISETENELNSIFIRMLPIIIAVILVVLSGLTGSIAISTMKQIKNFGIFFLCGCRWKDCFKIISANILIIFMLSGVLTIGGLVTMQIMNLDYIIGLSFEFNNILMSIAIIVFMFLVSIILPYAVIKGTSPVKTIKEIAE